MERRESDDLSLSADHQPFFFCLQHPSHRHHFFPPINHAWRRDFSPSDFSLSPLLHHMSIHSHSYTLSLLLLPRSFHNRMGEREHVREREKRTRFHHARSIPTFFYTASLSLITPSFPEQASRTDQLGLASEHPPKPCRSPPCISINGWHSLLTTDNCLSLLLSVHSVLLLLLPLSMSLPPSAHWSVLSPPFLPSPLLLPLEERRVWVLLLLPAS